MWLSLLIIAITFVSLLLGHMLDWSSFFEINDAKEEFPRCHTDLESLEVDNFATILIRKDGSVSLHRTLNPDAADGLQGEEYSEAWTLHNRTSAARQFLENGFWNTWMKINGITSGGISLYDGLNSFEAEMFLGFYTLNFVPCANDEEAACAVTMLPPGLYLFYVPV